MMLSKHSPFTVNIYRVAEWFNCPLAILSGSYIDLSRVIYRENGFLSFPLKFGRLFRPLVSPPTQFVTAVFGTGGDIESAVAVKIRN